MSPLLILGGAALALYLLGQSGGAKLTEAVIVDGVDSDDYDMTVDAVTAKVSPFDKKSLFVFYNDSATASDPALREAVNAAAKEAAIKGVVHVYGPAGDQPTMRLYDQGVMAGEYDGSDWDKGLTWISETAVAKVGMERARLSSADQAMAGMLRSRFSSSLADTRCPAGTIWSPAHGRCVKDPFSVKSVTHGGRVRASEMISKVKKGALVEMREHGLPYSTAKKIAQDHLKRDVHYYDR